MARLGFQVARRAKKKAKAAVVVSSFPSFPLGRGAVATFLRGPLVFFDFFETKFFSLCFVSLFFSYPLSLSLLFSSSVPRDAPIGCGGSATKLLLPCPSCSSAGGKGDKVGGAAPETEAALRRREHQHLRRGEQSGRPLGPRDPEPRRPPLRARPPRPVHLERRGADPGLE